MRSEKEVPGTYLLGRHETLALLGSISVVGIVVDEEVGSSKLIVENEAIGHVKVGVGDEPGDRREASILGDDASVAVGRREAVLGDDTGVAVGGDEALHGHEGVVDTKGVVGAEAVVGSEAVGSKGSVVQVGLVLNTGGSLVRNGRLLVRETKVIVHSLTNLAKNVIVSLLLSSHAIDGCGEGGMILTVWPGI